MHSYRCPEARIGTWPPFRPFYYPGILEDFESESRSRSGIAGTSMKSTSAPGLICHRQRAERQASQSCRLDDVPKLFVDEYSSTAFARQFAYMLAAQHVVFETVHVNSINAVS